jgi:hypothetical protein
LKDFLKLKTILKFSLSLKELKRFYIIIFFLVCTSKVHAQNNYPFYEQIAFDYFSKVILKEQPVTHFMKIKTSTFINYSGNETFENSLTCFEHSKTNQIDTLFANNYRNQLIENLNFWITLDKYDRKHFKVKKNTTDQYPRLFISNPISYEEKVYITIEINYYRETKIYEIEMDSQGNVSNWCSEIFVVVICN